MIFVVLWLIFCFAALAGIPTITWNCTWKPDDRVKMTINAAIVVFLILLAGSGIVSCVIQYPAQRAY